MGIKFMDPDITTEQILTLDVPTKPLPTDINPAKSQVAQLDEAMKDYCEDLREYKEKLKSIGQLRTRIQETVARTNLHCTFNKA
jgi:hypothetical protein